VVFDVFDQPAAYASRSTRPDTMSHTDHAM
jgi:hypothetical protein